MANKTVSLTKVVIPCRLSFANNEEEYTQEEIAGMLGISHQAVCDRLESVRKKIAEYYERNR